MSEAVGHETERDARALNALRAKMPAVERVIASEPAQPLIAEYGRTQVLAAIRATLARTLGVEIGRVNVKATTGEAMGFVGRGEGVAAVAVASVRAA